jgi:hypothetical protein
MPTSLQMPSIYSNPDVWNAKKKRKRHTTKETVVKPILSKAYGMRAQVDLIDMQSMQGRFSRIMVYQDHLTKFIVLRPLTSKPAAEVAYQLLDIFLLLGAPQILQSDNGQQELQAQKMVKRSRRVMVEGSIGDNVTVPIPSFDRGRTDPRNLIGVITDKDENGLYRIAVKSGMLEGKFTRNQFDICAYALYSINAMNMEKTVPLRKAVHGDSTCGGQGFVTCNCSGSKRCQTKKLSYSLLSQCMPRHSFQQAQEEYDV